MTGCPSPEVMTKPPAAPDKLSVTTDEVDLAVYMILLEMKCDNISTFTIEADEIMAQWLKMSMRAQMEQCMDVVGDARPRGCSDSAKTRSRT